LFLGLAIAACFEWAKEASTGHQKRWLNRVQWAYAAAVIGLFVYFLPILAAFKIPAEAFRQWMWFRSWI
jgi:dolichyl-phosphate-mannose--protein O-mannosyl transferase